MPLSPDAPYADLVAVAAALWLAFALARLAWSTRSGRFYGSIDLRTGRPRHLHRDRRRRGRRASDRR